MAPHPDSRPVTLEDAESAIAQVWPVIHHPGKKASEVRDWLVQTYSVADYFQPYVDYYGYDDGMRDAVSNMRTHRQNWEKRNANRLRTIKRIEAEASP